MGAAVASPFGPLAAEFFDASHPPDDDARLAHLDRLIPRDAGLLLDVMCGTGRALVPRARRGDKVHGVDRSMAMLERCEAKLAADGLAAPLFRQDVAQMNLPFRYAAAFVAGGALGLLTDPSALAAALERLRAHLVPPAVLVVECRIPAPDRQRLAAPLVEVETVRLADGTQLVRRSETTWTPEARLVRAAHRYTRRHGAQRKAEEHEVVTATWWERGEIAQALRDAGFGGAAIHETAAPAKEGQEGAGDAFLVAATAA